MHPIFLSSFALLFSLSTLSFTDANYLRLRGFSVDLIHRNSPLSPFYHNSEEESFESNITKTKFTYLMKLRVGTPPNHVDTFAIPDTGSDLIWLNGKGCEGSACDNQKAKFIEKPITPTDCSFRTYCELLPGKRQPTCPEICRYNISYKDNFTTEGELIRDKFSFPISGVDGKQDGYNIWFGVSTQSEGRFERRSAGIVGLGRGKLSLISQLSDLAGFDFKFSYCLPYDLNSTSKLSFGDQVTISEVNSTPLLTDSHGEGYYVHLAKIAVGAQNITVSEKIFIDSGSTFTYLNHAEFHEFKNLVKKEMGDEHPKSLGPYHDCFKRENGKELSIPQVLFHFEGMTVKLKEENFLDIYNKTSLCLTVVDGNTTNILGSRAQIDLNVAFDITQDKVSFDSQDCGKQSPESLHFPE